MEIKLTVNGKEVNLTEEQIKLLGLKEEKKSVFDRQVGGDYYHVEGNGFVYCERDMDDGLVENRFNVGNYCADKALMEQRALYETLNRLLWRASVEAGELDKPWDGYTQNWFIYYDCKDMVFKVHYNYFCKGNETYFPTKQSAEKALEEIVKPFVEEHPEFVW